MRKPIYIVLGILGAGIVVGLGFFLSYRNQSETPSSGSLPSSGAFSEPSSVTHPAANTGTAPASQGSLPAGGALNRLSNSPVKTYFVNNLGELIVVAPDGQISKIADGKIVSLRSTPTPDILDASFSFDGKKVLLISGSPVGPIFNLFDTDQKSLRSLPVQGTSAAWSPVAPTLAVLTTKGGLITVSTIDISKTNPLPKTVLSIHAFDLTIHWQDDHRLLLIPATSALSEGTAWSVDLTTKKLIPLVHNALGAELVWNSTIHQGLAFRAGTGGHGGMLSIINDTGTSLHALNFLTLPSKCTFHQETNNTTSTATAATSSKKIAPVPALSFLDCAIPNNSTLMARSLLPDEYEMRAMFTDDTLYKISLKDGTIVPLTEGGAKFDANLLHAERNKIYFINRIDGMLYSVNLF